MEAPLGDSSRLQSGDYLIAVGCPVGLDFTVTLGQYDSSHHFLHVNILLLLLQLLIYLTHLIIMIVLTLMALQHTPNQASSLALSGLQSRWASLI